MSYVWAGLALVTGASLWLGPVIRCARAAEPPKAAKPALGAEPKWESLFDGKTLKGWKVPQFGGEGKVYVKDGAIILGLGDTMTGITYTGKVPTVDYELSFEGKRVDGGDFFATATFPVGKSHCSFVLGGWGGSVVGLSSIDFADASENETTKFKSFKLNQWYHIRIRVTKEKIECWIDDEKMVDLAYVTWEDENGKKVKRERKISIRIECDLCRPLGISAWCTTGAVRNIRLRPLSEAEAKPAEK
jgi:hypothetical protein